MRNVAAHDRQVCNEQTIIIVSGCDDDYHFSSTLQHNDLCLPRKVYDACEMSLHTTDKCVTNKRSLLFLGVMMMMY